LIEVFIRHLSSFGRVTHPYEMLDSVVEVCMEYR